MPLPDHIRKQIAEGQAAFEANLKGEPIPGMDIPAIEHASLSTPAPAALEGAPAADDEHLDELVKVETDPPPEGSQGDPGPIGDPPPPEDDDELAKARHATATWKGRAQAAKTEQMKLARQLEELTATTTAQFNAIAKLQAQMAEREPAAVSQAVDTSSKSLVTAEEREQYGEEFSNYIEKLAQQIADRQVKQFAGQIDERLKSVTGQVEQFGKRTQQQIEQEFYRDLDRLAPDWRNLNEDPDFNQWLAERDIYSGDTRKNLLANACNWADSARAARFFTGYLAEQEALDPGKSTPTPGTGIAGRKMLEDMASPGRPRQPASREAPAPEKISDVEARNFFTEKTKGHYKDRPEEMKAIQRRIEAALLRGDITTLQ